MADHAELKHLERRISEARTSVKAYQDQKREIEEKLKHEQGILGKLIADAEKLKKKNDKLVVSEHAILRYLERVMKIDLEEIKLKILPDKLAEPIRTMGSGTYPADTHRVKIKDNVVITILTDDE